MSDIIDLEIETFKVKYAGVIYDLAYPEIGEIEKLEKISNEEATIGDIKAILIKSGLPAEVVDKLQTNHLEKLMSGLMGK